MPARCNKMSPDPKDHLGPFKLTQVDDRFEETSRIANCQACGNTVFHKVKKKVSGAEQNLVSC